MPPPHDYFKLEGRTPVAVSLEEYIRWDMSVSHDVKVVGKDQVGESEVSTVFLGHNHQFGNGPPLVFETMIFGDPQGYQKRYSTWAEAEAGHAETLAEIRPGARTRTRLERVGED